MTRRDDIYGHEFGDGGMPAPEWDRALVPPQGKISPLGDPTRWGASVTLRPSSDVGAHYQASPQIIQVSCMDGYARAWSIVGTVTADAALWAYVDGGLFVNSYLPALEVTMGVGQAQIVHNFRLRPIIDADAPFYLQGQGSAGGFLGDGTRLTKPFLIPGAVVGGKIQMRVEQLINNVAPVVPAFGDILYNVQLCPFNAGSGL